MKNYTVDEKEMLWTAMNHFIDSLKATRSVLHDTGNENGNAIAPALGMFQNLRVKLILDITPIEVKPSGDLCRHPCLLCGANERADSPNWAYVDEMLICDSCFKKHEPELYEQTERSNKEWWMKEHPEDFNPDGSEKVKVSESTADSLPF